MTTHLDEKIPKFVESLKLAIATSNWKKFYRLCKPIADRIIDEARRQEVISLEISYKSRFYKNFEALESAMNSESADLEGKVEPEESSKTGQEDSKICSKKEPMAGGQEDFREVFQAELAKSVKFIKEGMVKSFQALEDKIETRLRNMATSTIHESWIEGLGKSLEKKFDETYIGLTTGLMNNGKKIEQIAVNLKSLEVEIKRTSEEILMKLLEIAQQMELEDNERMAARIETLFGNLQKNYDEMKVDSMKRSEQKLDELVAKIEMQLKSKEEKLDGKLKEIKLREEALDKKMELMMELIREGFKKQKQRIVIDKDTVASKDDLTGNLQVSELIAEHALSTEHKLEELSAKLGKNVREQEAKFTLREEKMDMKMEAMVELMRQGFGQLKNSKTSTNLIEDCVKQQNPQTSSGIPQPQKSEVSEDDPELDFTHILADPDLLDSITGTSAITSLPTPDLLNDDEELKQIQEDFEKKLAEQEARYTARMEELKEKGRQKNEKAQKEIQDLTRNLSSRH